MNATAAALLVVAGMTAQAAEPATLTLACQGTTTFENAKPKPISMGIIINFTARTVEGFDFPAEITAVNQATVKFEGSTNRGGYQFTLVGKLDRVTGDVQAYRFRYQKEQDDLLSATEYALKCRPAQRMF
jgi:hypothetical protein